MWKKLLSANLLGALSPLGFVLSCTNASPVQDNLSFRNLKGFKDLIASYKYNEKIWQAKVTNWKDGDTISYQRWDPAGQKWVSQRGGKALSLRISFIDTPELHMPSASDPAGRGDLTAPEIKWAQAAKDWALQEIPEGSTIRVWKTGTDSYARDVGAIFYNRGASRGFNDNFAVNIIRRGYSFPRVANKSEIVLARGDEPELLNYLALPLYAAWREASQARVGLFGLAPGELGSVYKKHGIPQNELQVVEALADEWLVEPTFKKYKIYK